MAHRIEFRDENGDDEECKVRERNVLCFVFVVKRFYKTHSYDFTLTLQESRVYIRHCYKSLHYICSGWLWLCGIYFFFLFTLIFIVRAKNFFCTYVKYDQIIP